MDRRGFFQKSGGAAAVAAAGATGMLASSPSVHAAVTSVLAENAAGNAPGLIPRPLKLHVSRQGGSTTDEWANYLVRHGVKHWLPSVPTSGGRNYWVPSDFGPVMDFAAKHGLTVECVTLPFLGSTHIDRERNPAIMMADSPQRDRDIESIQLCISAMAAAGIPAFKYNMSLLGVLTSGRIPGRGNSTYREFDASKLSDPGPTRAGIVTADSFWERIDYFLQRVMPVCDQYKIRAACHPQDPGTPPGGYQGVLENVLSQPYGMGLFKFLSLYESPYHGLNLCCGTLAEALWDPDAEIYDIVRALARTKRVFNIHLRNIEGHRDNFREVWPDEGVINYPKLIQVLAEEGFEYGIDPDHMPSSPDDSGNRQGFAQGFGYIEGVIKAVDTFSPPYPVKPTASLQVVPNVLNLRTPVGTVNTVLTVAGNADLRTWGISQVNANGVKALSYAVSGDGKSVVATFRKADIASTATGNQFNIVGSLRGAKGTLVASATVTALR
ncbi:mannonate dehydratase [Aquincola sp. MAHUQ-54]|uniref:mannonate dehydratase n=1 Tax=Aquincola agrisoli TaxID=3119538 RepID=A0AAW9QDZ4_9BURK